MTQLMQSDYRKEVENRHALIIKNYKQLTKHHPDASEHSKAVTLGKTHGMTPEGIKKILKTHGLYQPRTQEAQ